MMTKVESGVLTWTVHGIVPKSLNSILGAHWWQVQRERKQWREALALIVRERTSRFRGKARLTVTVHRPRFLDTVNAYGAVKALEDAMVRLGWLEDDNPGHCELLVHQVKCHRNDKRTVIEWRPLE